MKRPNFTGTVYKKIDKPRRKPWVAIISIRDPEHNRKRKTVGYASTKKEAMKLLANYDFNPIEKPNIKLCELYDEWSVPKYKTLSASAVGSHKAAYKHLEQLKNIKFNNLRTAHMQNIIDHVSETLKRDTLVKIKSLLNQLYVYAMQNDITNKNYSTFIKLPKKERLVYDNFTILDIKRLFKNDDSDVVKIILLLIYTGFRPSALFAMTKFSYDRENKILVGGIKTEAGFDRPVPIHPDIQGYIDYFDSLNGEALICKQNGKKYSLTNFRGREYFPMLESLGFRRILPRNARHTFASIMKMADADETAIEQMMGHEDYDFTKKTYTQLEAEYLHTQMNKLKIK